MTKRLDLKKCWIFIFTLAFLLVPLCFIDEAFLWAVGIVAASVFVMYKFNMPKFSLLLFSVAFVIRLVIVLILKTPPESDFLDLFNASQSVLNSDYSFLELNYFKTWAYQLGFVYFQTLLLRIWNDIMMLKLFNCLIAAATNLLIYYIANELTSEKAARTVAVIYCFLPFPLFYVTILSNQFFSTFLIYLGLYILVAKSITIKSYFKYLIFGVILALANIIRPESIIPLTAVIIFLLLTVNRQNYKEHIINIGILILTYFALKTAISSVFVATGLSPYGLSNNDPYWKFVLGLNAESSGGWNLNDTQYEGNAQAELEIIKERLSAPISTLCRLFLDKIDIFWFGTSLYWSFNYCYTQGLELFGNTFRVSDDCERLVNTGTWSMLILYLLVIIGVIGLLRSKKYDEKSIIFINQVFVTFGVYLLIEVQARYSYFIQCSVLILASLGIDFVCKKIKKYRKARALVKTEE